MWMLPLHLHDNQKSNYDDDDDNYMKFFDDSLKVSSYRAETIL